MIEIAKKYYNSGTSVVPVSDHKIPMVEWDLYKKKLIPPSPVFKRAWGIAIVCGKVSGGIECIDIDCKYDLTKSLYEDFKKLIEDTQRGILEKITIQSTVNGGYHFVYKCKKTEGNLKLANRDTTVEEKRKTYEKAISSGRDEKKAITQAEHDKVRVLIETRGEGGYFVAAPSKGYKVIYGSLESINEITEQEREVIISCAKTFNSVYEQVKQEPYEKLPSETKTGKNPFKDFNERGDALKYLVSNGWKIVRESASKALILRPGGEGAWSADYHFEKKLLYVFTTSSEFEPNKAYNNSAILAKIQFNNDWSATAKHLFEIGYGEKTSNTPKIEVIKSTIIAENVFTSFLASQEDMNKYIQTLRDGSFKEGLKTNIPELDRHFRFKEATLLVNNGHDNTGKSALMWYLAVLSSILHSWKWGILSAENKIGGIKRKLMEFRMCKNIMNMTNDDVQEASSWVRDNFFIIKNDDIYNYKQVIQIAEWLKKEYNINFFLVDPYNALDRTTDNHHEYDYKAMGEMRVSITKYNYGIAVNCHAVTEALRRTYPKGHRYEGHPMPPQKADTEGGGKFSNRADDLLTTHRMTQHPSEWMFTEIHVRKIKEMETGGKPTVIDAPIRLEYIIGGCGFISEETKTNPIADYLGINQEKNKKAYKLTPSPDDNIPDEELEIPF